MLTSTDNDVCWLCVCNLTIWETASVSVCWNTTENNWGTFWMYIACLLGLSVYGLLLCSSTHPACMSLLVETYLMLFCVLLSICPLVFGSAPCSYFRFFFSRSLLSGSRIICDLQKTALNYFWMLLWDFAEFPSKQNPQNIFYRINEQISLYRESCRLEVSRHKSSDQRDSSARQEKEFVSMC